MKAPLQTKTSSSAPPTFTPVPRGLLQRKCACGGTPGPTGECDACRKKKLQRRSENLDLSFTNHPPSSVSEVPPIVHEELRSPGELLNARTGAFMEPQFGHDFSRVRVHSGSKAEKSACAIEIARPRASSAVGLSRAGQVLTRGQRDAGPSDTGVSRDASVAPTTPCRPVFRSLNAVPGTIGMTSAWNGSCELALGTPSGAGMTFNSQVDVPAGCTGTLQFVQLINRCLQRRNAAGTNERLNTGSDVLDSTDPYASLGVTAPGRISFATNDSPGGGYTDGYVYRQIVDSFKMWLLWTPDTPAGSPRIALARVQWNWTAKANKTGSSGGCAADWTVSDAVVHGGTGSAIATLPTWTQTYPTGFAYGPGTCS
jgi:hypothetical protein